MGRIASVVIVAGVGLAWAAGCGDDGGGPARPDASGDGAVRDGATGTDAVADTGPTPTYTANVQPILAMKCDDCHTTGNSGGVNHASSYADTQKPSDICPGRKVGECILNRVQLGRMPLNARCTGDPAMDVDNPACLTAEEQATIAAWIAGGMPE